MALPKLRGVILATMQFVGILAGLAFSPLTHLFRDRLLLVSGVAFGVTQLLIGVSPNLLILALVTIASGFAYSVALTTVYNVLSDKMPAGVFEPGNIHCSFGMQYRFDRNDLFLSLLGTISSAPVFIFWIFWYPHDPGFIFWPLDCAKEQEVIMRLDKFLVDCGVGGAGLRSSNSSIKKENAVNGKKETAGKATD